MSYKLKPVTRLSIIFILAIVLSGSILTYFSINNISNLKELIEKKIIEYIKSRYPNTKLTHVLHLAARYLSDDDIIDGVAIEEIMPMLLKKYDPNLQNKNVEKTIQCLEIRKDNLSSDEMNVAMTLGRKARLSFKGWIEYAPCAINEGPIFTLKENKRLSNCFKDVVKILQGTDQNQDIIRAKLEEHYDIEV